MGRTVSFTPRNLVHIARRFGLANALGVLWAETTNASEYVIATPRGRFVSNRDDWALQHLAVSWPKVEALVERVPVNARRPLVLDVGANLGLFSTLLKWRLPQAEVHAFEPSPLACGFIRRNVPAPVTVNEVCVGDVDGTVDFYEATESTQVSTAVPEEAARWTTRKRVVPCLRLDGYLSKLDCADRYVVLKVDVQGFEQAVIAGLGAALNEVDLIFLESSWLAASSVAVALDLVARAQRWSPVGDVLYGADLCLEMKRSD